MDVKLDRVDLMNLITGLHPPYKDSWCTEFCGNQYNEAWRWKGGAFDFMSDSELFEFYKLMKDGYGLGGK